MGRRVSTVTRVETPQRAPLWATDTSRRAASVVKLAGKLATTSTRSGSATSPASALYSAMDWYWLRRYFWMTFSMCAVMSARRCSMWDCSVQMRLATSCSS